MLWGHDLKLIDLAKKNLEEYIAIKEVLELIAKTQQTPLSLVATFLISQGFETKIQTYEADKYYVVRSDDSWNWGHFEYTNEIISNLADNDDYFDTFEFSEKDIPKYLKDTYWKRSELYNLELIKKLSLDFYFRVQDIRNIVCNTSIDFKKYENKIVFSTNDVKELLKSGIPSYLPSSQEKYFLIDSFVTSSIEFFECDFSGGFEITKDSLIQLFLDNGIVISGFSDLITSENQQEGGIWDTNYLSILQNEILDLERLELDVFCLNNEIESLKNQKYPLYFKNKTFTLHEAACLISGYNPTITFGQHTYVNWLKANPDYEEASDFIYSFLRADSEYEYLDSHVHIGSDTIKKILTESNLLIDGFNDSSLMDVCLSNQNLKENKELSEKIKQLEKDLNALEAKQNTSDFILTLEQAEKVELKKENHSLGLEIKELEEQLSNKVIEHPHDKSLGFLSKVSVENSHPELKPEQEIPNSRQRNNVLKIISILAEMSQLPPEPFTAFNMMEAYANSNGKEIPSKDTIAKWLKKAMDSN